LCCDVILCMVWQDYFYMKPRLIGWVIALGLFAHASSFGITARDLLMSQEQRARDLGAAVQQRDYVAPPRAGWDFFLRRLKPGMKRADIEDVLQSVKAVPGGSGGTGIFETREYRLDDLWVVNCNYTNAVLAGAEINEHMNDFWVAPPTNYTGDWVTYWINGQRSLARHYESGKLEGTATDYYSDGSKYIVSTYHNGIEEGEETGYFRSGDVKFKGQFKAGRQVGHWVWYKEDGKVESVKDFEK